MVLLLAQQTLLLRDLIILTFKRTIPLGLLHQVVQKHSQSLQQIVFFISKSVEMQILQTGRLMVLVKVGKVVLELYVSLHLETQVVMDRVWCIAFDEDLHQEYMMGQATNLIIERVETHNCLVISTFQIFHLRINMQAQTHCSQPLQRFQWQILHTQD